MEMEAKKGVPILSAQEVQFSSGKVSTENVPGKLPSLGAELSKTAACRGQNGRGLWEHQQKTLDRVEKSRAEFKA